MTEENLGLSFQHVPIDDVLTDILKQQRRDEASGKVRQRNDSELDLVALKVIDCLNGLSVGQALHVLQDRAPGLLKSGHVVDVKALRVALGVTDALT